jgi:hypothetical protein
MNRSRKFLTLGAVVASLAVSASPALARGGGDSGGGGGTVSTPNPAPAPNADGSWTLCPDIVTDTLPDGSGLFANEIPGIACVIARSNLNGTVSLYELRLGTGWVGNVNSSGGSKGVDVDVIWPATGKKYNFRIAPGKTVIR